MNPSGVVVVEGVLEVTSAAMNCHLLLECDWGERKKFLCEHNSYVNYLREINTISTQVRNRGPRDYTISIK